MPELPVQSALGYLGVLALVFGMFLILAGLEVVQFQQVTVARGRKTWMVGLAFVLIGLAFLLTDLGRTITLPSALRHATEAIPTPTSPVAGNEMLANGSFEQELGGWEALTMGTAAAVFEVDRTQATSGVQSLKVTVSQVDGTDYDVSFQQSGLDLRAGQQYHVTFDAKSDMPREITFEVSQAHSPWEGLGLWDRRLLSTIWQRYGASFTATQTELNGMVQFSVGQVPGTVWFDNVSLVR